MTSAVRASRSYGHSSQKGAESSKATFRSASCSWHSASSVGDRPGYTGSPIPHSCLTPAWACAKARQAAMMHAGLSPTSAMSAKLTSRASAPRPWQSKSIFGSLTTTRMGSPALIARRMNDIVPARNSAMPEYRNASWRSLPTLPSTDADPGRSAMTGQGFTRTARGFAQGQARHSVPAHDLKDPLHLPGDLVQDKAPGRAVALPVAVLGQPENGPQ